MSTYLVAICRKILVEKMNNLIGNLPGSIEEERRLESMSNACSALFMGKTVDKMITSADGGDFFSGWLLDEHLVINDWFDKWLIVLLKVIIIA